MRGLFDEAGLADDPHSDLSSAPMNGALSGDSGP
jgi:hypothetical protein